MLTLDIVKAFRARTLKLLIEVQKAIITLVFAI